MNYSEVSVREDGLSRRICSLVLPLMLVVALIVPVMVAHAEEGEKAGDAKAPAPPKVVVRVNGIAIDERDLAGETKRLIPGRLIHRSVSESRMAAIRKKALDNLIIDELIHQEARKSSIKIGKRAIDKRMKEIRKNFKRPFEEILMETNFTMEDVRRQVEKELLLERYMERKDKNFWKKVKTKINDAYVKDYYDSNKEKFKVPERVRLREILIKADPGGGPKHWKVVREKAVEVLKRIEGGEEFAEVAKEVSDSPYGRKGGDMGLVHRGSFIPEIEKAVKKLKVGEIAGPVWSLHGYHILKVEEITPAVQRTFDEVKVGLKRELEEKEFETMKEGWIEGLKEQAEMEYFGDIEKEK
ncbi:MAG: peptidylprolyl isomerase [Thermodesulfobacteriota bacterium]